MRLPDRRRWQRLSPLLDELLGLDAEAQRMRVASVRAQDPALGDELQWLLDASCRLAANRFLLGDADDDK